MPLGKSGVTFPFLASESLFKEVPGTLLSSSLGPSMERSKEVSASLSQFSFNSDIKLQWQALKSLAYPQGFICCYCFILALFLIHGQLLGTRPLPFFNPLLLGKEIRRQEENPSLFYLSLSFVQVLGAMRPGVWQVSTQDTSDTQGLLTVQWNVYLIFFL